MKITKLSALIILASLIFNSVLYAGDVFDELSSLEKDKYVHFGATVVLSHVSYPVFLKYLKNKKKAMWYSFAVSVAGSAAKEVYDSNKNGFDTGDLFAGVLGSCTIFVVSF